jgi:hypothetical protein
MNHIVIVIKSGNVREVYSTTNTVDIEIVDLDLDRAHDDAYQATRLATMLKYEKELKRIETN